MKKRYQIDREQAVRHHKQAEESGQELQLHLPLKEVAAALQQSVSNWFITQPAEIIFDQGEHIWISPISRPLGQTGTDVAQTGTVWCAGGKWGRERRDTLQCGRLVRPANRGQVAVRWEKVGFPSALLHTRPRPGQAEAGSAGAQPAKEYPVAD